MIISAYAMIAFEIQRATQHHETAVPPFVISGYYWPLRLWSAEGTKRGDKIFLSSGELVKQSLGMHILV